MRVALISPLFESVPPRLYGGTERVVYNLCRGLAAQPGVEVTLFASGDSQPPEEVRLEAMSREALRLMMPPALDPNAYHIRMLAEVARRAGEFDVIHNHHDYWMLPLTELCETPMVTTLHGRLDKPDLTLPMPHYPRSLFVSISDSQRQPVPDLRWLRTVYHGIEPSDFAYSDRPGEYLAFLGRITPEKRPEWSIEIAKRSGVPLKIAAKIEGPESQAYYDTFLKPHVDGKFIEYLGEISDREKSEFLGGALALTFPIDWPEPFGLVVIESLACGTPVLARPCGSVPELFESGIHGFIDSSIERLAARVADVPRLSRLACRRWVETRYSLQRMTEDYLHVYRFVSTLGRSPGLGKDLAGLAAVADISPARANRDRRDIVYPVERVAHGNT